MKQSFLLIPLLFVLGCNAPAPNTPAVPDTPQVRVLKYARLGAASNVALAGTVNVLCRPAPPATPQLDAVTCSKAAVYVRATAAAFDKVVDEVQTIDSWAVMRSKIAGIIATEVTSLAVADPVLKAQIAALQLLVQQILEVL